MVDAQQKEEWLRRTIPAMLEYGRSLPAYCSPVLLAHDLLREENTVSLSTSTDTVAHYTYLTPKGEKICRIIPVASREAIYTFLLETARPKVVVECVPHQIADAFSKKSKAHRVSTTHMDYLLTQDYAEGYAGGSWRSVRRSANKSSAVGFTTLLSKCTNEEIQQLMVVISAWVDAKKQKKESVAWQTYNGKAPSQVVWVLANRSLLAKLGVTCLVTGHRVEGKIVSFQIFCDFTTTDVYCFTRRYLPEAGECHFVYHEMDKAITFFGKGINDGWGGGTLTTMKQKYGERIMQSNSVWVA